MQGHISYNRHWPLSRITQRYFSFRSEHRCPVTTLSDCFICLVVAQHGADTPFWHKWNLWPRFRSVEWQVYFQDLDGILQWNKIANGMEERDGSSASMSCVTNLIATAVHMDLLGGEVV